MKERGGGVGAGGWRVRKAQIKEEAAESEVGLTLQEGVHLFKWEKSQVVRSPKISKRVHNRASDQQLTQRLQPLTLTGLLYFCLVFTVIHTSTLRMIYIHNQVLFEQKSAF